LSIQTRWKLRVLRLRVGAEYQPPDVYDVHVLWVSDVGVAQHAGRDGHSIWSARLAETAAEALQMFRASLHERKDFVLTHLDGRVGFRVVRRRFDVRVHQRMVALDGDLGAGQEHGLAALLLHFWMVLKACAMHDLDDALAEASQPGAEKLLGGGNALRQRGPPRKEPC